MLDWYAAMKPGKWYACFGEVLRDVRWETLMDHVRNPKLPGLEYKLKHDGAYFRRPEAPT